ncbi:MAG: hypothetical protein LBV45_05135 [Xanthomonadaceae bacterium]|nr:hypothetical protein [Xanthomonadaceae bacterium]
MSYPFEIQSLHNTLLRLPGVYIVSSGIQSLQGVSSEYLSLAKFSHLPHGALQRTDGGQEQEVLIQTELGIARTQEGWQSLEFLARFVQEQAQDGVSLQLRPFALPLQLGNVARVVDALRWHIDLFVLNATRNLSALLAEIRRIDKSLACAIDFNEQRMSIGVSPDARIGDLSGSSRVSSGYSTLS